MALHPPKYSCPSTARGHVIHAMTLVALHSAAQQRPPMLIRRDHWLCLFWMKIEDQKSEEEEKIGMWPQYTNTCSRKILFTSGGSFSTATAVR